MTDDGGPAFPHEDITSDDYGSPGMSLRDYCAAQAMDEMIYGPNTPRDPDIMPLEEEAGRIAKMSYMVADAMLKERSK